MRLDPLSLIAMRHGGDKFGSHLYTPIYHRLFAHLRDQPIRLLELGVGGYDDPHVGGASLLAWAEYFPQARIVGLDIAEKRLSLPGNVTLLRGSQDDAGVLQRVVAVHGPFDIVIDDASHAVGLTLRSFQLLYPTLTAEGIYAVEDTQTAFVPGFGGRSDGVGTMFDLAHALGLAMHGLEGFRAPDAEADAVAARFGPITQSVAVYRNLIVVQRGDNTYPSNTAFDFSHASVQAVYEAMAARAAQTPSPRDSLARIDMNVWGGRQEHAARLALATAERYPNDLSLLRHLHFMMRWANRPAECALIERRIAALEAWPDGANEVKAAFPPAPDG